MLYIYYFKTIGTCTMSTFLQKVRFLFFPVMGVIAATTVGYVFLGWLLLIQWHLFRLPDEWTDFGLPSTLPIFVLFVVLRKKLSIIPNTSKRINPYVSFWLVIWLPIFFTTGMAWAYVSAAGGKLTQLDKISSLDKRQPTRYYIAKHAFIDMAHAKSYYYKNTPDKRGDVEFYCYNVAPIYDDPAMKTGGNVWMGIVHTGNCSRSADDFTKDSAWQAFLDKYAVGLTNKLPPDYVYFEKCNTDKDQNAFNKAIDNGEENMVLLPVNEAFEARTNIGLLLGAIICYGVTAIVLLIFIAIVPIDINPDPHKKSL